MIYYEILDAIRCDYIKFNVKVDANSFANEFAENGLWQSRTDVVIIV